MKKAKKRWCYTCRYYRTWSTRYRLFWATRATLEVCPDCGRRYAKPEPRQEIIDDVNDVEEYDTRIYSNISQGDKRLTWKELYQEQLEKTRKLQAFQRMVMDLDRNVNGRHEGDADVGDPSGISQGNPKLKTGNILGYDISGNPYIMPNRGHRHDPQAWGAR